MNKPFRFWLIEKLAGQYGILINVNINGKSGIIEAKSDLLIINCQVDCLNNGKYAIDAGSHIILNSDLNNAQKHHP